MNNAPPIHKTLAKVGPDEVPFRKGPPPVLLVLAHEGNTWQWRMDGLVEAFYACRLNVRAGKVIMVGYDKLDLSMVEFRPCTESGTPVPWERFDS